MTKIYKIYKHTFKSTNKSYIGYTSQTIPERLNDHLKMAKNNSQYHFHRSIRKYGSGDIATECLAISESHSHIKKLEVHYIKTYNTFMDGLNMTKGGDGGSICNGLPPERYKEYIRKRSIATAGENNPMYSGLSDLEIIDIGIKILKDKKMFYRRLYISEASNYGAPKSFSKNRFNGKWSVYENLVKEKAISLGINTENFGKYKQTNAHKDKLSAAVAGFRWYTDGQNNIQVKPNDSLPKGNWVLGRTIIKD
jgi:hypothetical protein